jgi:hypothetical protein
MKYSERIKTLVLDQLHSLDYLRALWKRISVVVVGSVGAGFGDDHSDLDINVYIPADVSESLYDCCWRAVDAGEIDILNPRARLFHEFPLTYLDGVDGHYWIEEFEPLEAKIREFDDVSCWIILNSISLHDPKGRIEAMRAAASHYPVEILNARLARHFYQFRENFWATKTPLERGHTETVTLLCIKGLIHLFKFCILAEKRPYPYDKWLYRVAMESRLGTEIKEYVDELYAEIRCGGVRRQVPERFIEPGDRNERFENYRIYFLFKAIRKVVDENRPKITTDRGLVF